VASRRERGSAVVEFALVLPILLVVALALVQVGLLVRDRLVLEEAARAAAREAAVSGSEEDIAEAATGAAAVLDSTRMGIEVRRGGGRGEPVTVDVRYTATISVPFVDWLFPPSVAMSASATMRQEFQ
jgi:Flp pilus assembly protein TadG